MVAGILSIVCCSGYFFGWLFVGAGLVLGILAYKDPTTDPTRKNMALAGIITSAVGLFLTVLFFVVVVVLSVFS